MSDPTMTLDAFRATAAPISDELWAAMQEAYGPGHTTPRAFHVEYADGNVMYFHEEKWHTCSWWYSPVGRESLAAAEEDLYKWRAEFL